MQNVLKTTMFAAVVAVGLFSIEASQADTPGKRIAEQRSVGAFRAIELSGPYDVAIDAQGRSGLTLSGEREQLDKIETFVRGDTLVVRPTERTGFHFGFTARRQTVTIQIGTHTLERLQMTGSGDVVLEQVNGERIALAVTGPGDLRASGAIKALELRVSGSGNADLERVRAGTVDLTMSGPGDVRLAHIDGRLQARLSGSGDLDAHDLRLASLDARLDGPGDALLDGTAADFKADVRGSGDLDGSGLRVGRATVKSRGPGGVELAQVSDALDAELRGSGGLKAEIKGRQLVLTSSGPGDFEISGRVDTVRARLSGSGELDGSSLNAGRADIAVTGPGSAKVQLDQGAGGGRMLVVERGGSRQAPD